MFIERIEELIKISNERNLNLDECAELMALLDINKK